MSSKFPKLAKNWEKLLLISLDWTRPKDPPLSLGQASILAKLRSENIPVIHKSWSVNNSNFNIDEVFRFVMSEAKTGVHLALGTFVWHEPATQTLLSELRRNDFPGLVILGGPQISYTRRGLEDYYPQADIFIRGYGENALTQLWQLLSESDSSQRPQIAGVHYSGQPDSGLSADIDFDQLPSPYLTGTIKPQRFIRWETQRGCPFKCAFCQHRQSDNKSMKVRRQLKYSRIMQEVQWILDNPVIQDIAVLDPTFNSGPNYLNVLRALTVGGYRGKLALQCRIEMVSQEFLDAVQELNRTGRVVLEFGLQTIHRSEERIIQRPNNMTKVKRVLTETSERNIQTEVSLIFGLPGQTVQSFQESIDFCKTHRVPVIYGYPLMLLRGTPLHDAKERLGLIESSDLDFEKIDRVQQNIPHVVASPSFTYEEWLAMAEMAEALDRYNAGDSDETSKQRENKEPKMRATLSNTSFWQAKRRVSEKEVTSE